MEEPEQSVLVECRPLLRVCHFFIKHRFYPKDTSVIVNENEVRIVTDSLDLEILMPESVKMLKDSLSGLCFNEDSLLFRTQTVPPKNQGSFKAELLTLKNEKCKFQIYKPKVNVGEETHIFCGFCSYQLTKKIVKFSKILPLPETFDSGDFFCHGKIDVSLDPKVDNLFYGSYYYNIHPSIIIFDDTIYDLIVCKGCMSWLGNIEEKNAQLWNSTSYFSKATIDKRENTALDDFLQIIKKATNEFMPNNKLILYCDIGNNERHYLLLWIMDKKLSLLSSRDDLLNGMVTLKEHKMTKLLYSYHTSKSETVLEWVNLTNTNGLKVSKAMLAKGVEHLKEMSNQIPEDFRTSQNMNISFLTTSE